MGEGDGDGLMYVHYVFEPEGGREGGGEGEDLPERCAGACRLWTLATAA